jgi:hypothetical protein
MWLVSAISLFLPGISVHVIAILFPESWDIMIQKFQAAQPLHGLPRVEVRHYKAHWITMIRSQRLAIVMSGEQDFRSVEIGERNVGGKALLGVNQNVSGLRLGVNAVQQFLHGDAGPTIVEAAPASNTVEVARGLDFGQRIEFSPGQFQTVVDQAVDLEVPGSGIEIRDGTVVKHRPFQS